ATLVALDLTLDARASAVLGGETLDGGDEVVTGQEAGTDRDEHGALGDLLGLGEEDLRLGRRGGRGLLSGRPCALGGASSVGLGGRRRFAGRVSLAGCGGLLTAGVAGGSHW